MSADYFSWVDCTDTYEASGSVARGGGGYWPCMVNLDFTELSGSIASDDARSLASELVKLAEACDAATLEERTARPS